MWLHYLQVIGCTERWFVNGYFDIHQRQPESQKDRKAVTEAVSDELSKHTSI